MNDQVDQMIAPDIQFTKMVINSKGVISDKTTGIKAPDIPDIRQVADVFIIDDVERIIKMECIFKRIGINDNTQ